MMILTNSLLWRVTGFVSSIVGFTCYAISPSFQNLFGQWTPLKIIMYIVFTSLLSILMVFLHKCTSERMKNFLVKAQVGSLVLSLVSLWSALEELREEGKVENGYAKMMKLTSSLAFAMMALSWSRLLQLGFEVGLFNFFFGCFLVMMMKINLKLAPLAAFLCFLLVNIRGISDYLHEMTASAATPHRDRSAEAPIRPEEEVPLRNVEETDFNTAILVFQMQAGIAARIRLGQNTKGGGFSV